MFSKGFDDVFAAVSLDQMTGQGHQSSHRGGIYILILSSFFLYFMLYISFFFSLFYITVYCKITKLIMFMACGLVSCHFQQRKQFTKRNTIRKQKGT